MDPDDQSTWLYHAWLLGESFSLHGVEEEKPILAPTTTEERVEVLKGEIKLLEELLQEAPESKCLRLFVGLANICVGCLNFLSIYKVSLARLQREKVGDDVREMIGKLIEKDPMRRGLYSEWQRTLDSLR